ncbi:MAG: hypothetical protein J6U20_08920 [Fibrobacter sp.]|nr:hypothetical protein [Fibrobacter sp.]
MISPIADPIMGLIPLYTFCMSSEEELSVFFPCEEELFAAMESCSVRLPSEEEISSVEGACSWPDSFEEELSISLKLFDNPSASFFGELMSELLLQLAQNKAVNMRKRLLKCL